MGRRRYERSRYHYRADPLYRIKRQSYIDAVVDIAFGCTLSLAIFAVAVWVAPLIEKALR